MVDRFHCTHIQDWKGSLASFGKSLAFSRGEDQSQFMSGVVSELYRQLSNDLDRGRVKLSHRLGISYRHFIKNIIPFERYSDCIDLGSAALERPDSQDSFERFCESSSHLGKFGDLGVEVMRMRYDACCTLLLAYGTQLYEIHDSIPLEEAGVAFVYTNIISNHKLAVESLQKTYEQFCLPYISDVELAQDVR